MDIEEELRTHDDERLYEEADVLMSKGADEITRLRQQVATLTEQRDELAAVLEEIDVRYMALPERACKALAAIQSSEVAK